MLVNNGLLKRVGSCALFLFLVTGCSDSKPKSLELLEKKDPQGEASFSHTDLLVGSAAVDMTPEIGAPLAGFGGGKRRILPFDLFRKYPHATYFKASIGKRDPIRSKAFYLENLNSKLLFISLDLVAIPSELRTEIVSGLADLEIPDAQIIISATHTHSGPGAITTNKFWQLLAVDRLDQGIRDFVVSQIRKSARLAYLGRKPSRLYTLNFSTTGLQRNRRGRPGHFDEKAHSLLAKDSEGNWIGGLINFAIHGTALGLDNLFLSADMPGAIEREVELLLSEQNRNVSPPPTLLFINGAEGDVAPIEGGEEGLANVSHSFREQFKVAFSGIEAIEPQWKVQVEKVHLPSPKLPTGNCILQNKLKFLHPYIKIPMKRFLPGVASLTRISLDGIEILTWPGEPTTSLGERLRRKAFLNGAREAWVFGLTNDHLSYFTTPTEFLGGGYEACASFYGEYGGVLILETYAKLLKRNE